MNFYAIYDDVINDIDLFIQSSSYRPDDFYWDVNCLKFSDDNRLNQFFSDYIKDIKNYTFEWNKRKQSDLFKNYYIQNVDNFIWLYNNLSDQESKNTLLRLIKSQIAYSICGDLYLLLYPNQSYVDVQSQGLLSVYESFYEIEDIKIYGTEYEIYDTWKREQYSYKDKVVPNISDTVISLGCYYGETSIWFAKKVGNKGIIYALDASKKNIRVAKKNIIINHIENIILGNICLSDKEDKKFFLDANGSSRIIKKEDSSYLHKKEDYIEICTTTLDKYCDSNDINHINFLKIDIEGMDLAAIKGAKRIIQHSKPNIAVAIYHKPSDFIEIPKLLKYFVPDYKFYLSNKRLDFNETILFATVY